MFTNEEFFRSDFKEVLQDVPFIKNSKGIEVSNSPAVFDIETSSFLYQGKKCAVMYAFTLGINGRSFLGRTWKDFEDCYKSIVSFYHTGKDKHFVIYVHNLAFEFQFLRKRFKWESVFSNNVREPIYARTIDGIEFRCSLQLSGYSLAYLGDHIVQKYKVKKMVGDLDYSKIRFSETPLTPKEEKYILHDGLVVMAYIQEEIEKDGNLAVLPITKTGFVRKYCRQECFFGGSASHDKTTTNYYKKYRGLMKSLKVTADEYKELKQGFQGGFTHANRFYVGEKLSHVSSFDYCSDYPSRMVTEKFPMSSGRIIGEPKNRETFEFFLKDYCCLFQLDCTDLKERTDHCQDSPISASKCIVLEEGKLNNGRIISAKKLSIVCTELDYDTYKRFYRWKNEKISRMIVYQKARLPKPFILSILKLYRNKTELKGVEDRVTEYMNSKEKLNSCYGMTVTDIAKPEVCYDDDHSEEMPLTILNDPKKIALWQFDNRDKTGDWWHLKEEDVNSLIQNYNESKTRFLFYPWGVWVTAYARYYLFKGIEACGMDYVYSDTDSIKCLNKKKHLEYFERYNEEQKERNLTASKALDIPIEYFEPSTIKGIKKPIGVWENDSDYSSFKTLGAKRYMDTEKRRVSLTVSGVNKKVAIPYLRRLAYREKKRIYDLFEKNLVIPAPYAGKNVHTYIDDKVEGDMKDYKGKMQHFEELSGVHLAPGDYSLGMSEDFMFLVSNAMLELEEEKQNEKEENGNE